MTTNPKLQGLPLVSQILELYRNADPESELAEHLLELATLVVSRALMDEERSKPIYSSAISYTQDGVMDENLNAGPVNHRFTSFNQGN